MSDSNANASARVAVPPASVAGAPIGVSGHADPIARNAAAVQLIRSWITQDLASGEDDRSWAELKQELDLERSSARKLFP